jgi:hypothetical protein
MYCTTYITATLVRHQYVVQIDLFRPKLSGLVMVIHLRAREIESGKGIGWYFYIVMYVNNDCGRVLGSVVPSYVRMDIYYNTYICKPNKRLGLCM